MYNQQSHPADEGGLNKFIKMLLRKNNKFVGLNKFVQMLSRKKNSYKYQSQYNKYCIELYNCRVIEHPFHIYVYALFAEPKNY